jgi:CheY-like chemotaxis protein
MSVSILVVDDEPDVAELFRQRYRRETLHSAYVLHYATSRAEALDQLAGENQAHAGRGPVRHQQCPAWTGSNWSARSSSGFPTCQS